MTFSAWLGRSLGRAMANPRTHLIDTAALLGFGQEAVQRMKAADDEECELIFSAELQVKCGRTVDWRAKPTEVRDAVLRYLPVDEQVLLQRITLDPSLPPPKAVQVLESSLLKTSFALRIMESFGDFYFVLVLPRAIESTFDAANLYWTRR